MTVTVIGAVNMDICGRPANALIMRDSNPGAVTLTPGGVGRNIAHDLCLLGLDVRFIAALGDDGHADTIKKRCAALGMDMSLCLTVPGERTSSYLYITDDRGDMCVAVNDMEIAKRLTPEYLAPLMGEINLSDAVVIDANLSAETIAFIAESCTAPLYCDPVSVTKAAKILPVLHRLRAIKPNDIEARYMTGEEDVSLAAQKLCELGVQRVFVSCGENGMAACEAGHVIMQPCRFGKVVNTTGAGDAATAAIVWADLKGFDLERTALAAQRAGAMTVACPYTNNPELSEEKI